MLNEGRRKVVSKKLGDFANIFCKKFVKMVAAMLHLRQVCYLINEKKIFNPGYLFMHCCIVF